MIIDSSGEERPGQDSKAQYQFLIAKLGEYGLVPSAEAFTTNLAIRWELHNSGEFGYRTPIVLDRTSGDLLNLGAGDWLYVGTVYGIGYYKGQRPVSYSCSLEYKKSIDTVKWTVDEYVGTFAGISAENAQVQYRTDVSGNPQAIIVRAQQGLSGPFSGMNLQNGSYTTFRS